MSVSNQCRITSVHALSILYLSGSICLLAQILPSEKVLADDKNNEFKARIQPLLDKYCMRCHSPGDPSGSIDLKSPQTSDEVDSAFETWRSAMRAMKESKMPPEKEPAPTAEEVQLFTSWFNARFVDNVEARPGPFRPRRLSAREYRNTLRSLLGFDLQANVALAEDTVAETSLVMKLLPTDPPGPSRYRNDTFTNPLTPHAWDSYSQLADSAIEELFSSAQRKNLESLAGAIPAEGFALENAERLLRSIQPRAFRRMVDDEQILDVLKRLKLSPDLMGATQFELKAILMSPGFLYRGLLMESEPGKRQPVDNFELAERLSYFLWADMPDEELLKLAATGQLDKEDTLRSQTERMLDSPKARNLADDWAVQWLLLDDIVEVSTDVPYVVALKSQPIDFIDYLIKEDRPLLELIDSDVEFINVHTAGFYAKDRKQLAPYSRPKGIENEIVPNQRIQLVETPGRGGLLTMPGLLAMNRGAIIRGTWILERILGEYLPDPPANVGQVRANKEGENLTFRQRFEQHRSQATCAICHDKIDPLGFVLESYDEKGSFLLASQYQSRKQKIATDTSSPLAQSIDTSGKLPTGETFNDIDDLKKILKSSQRQAVIRNIVSQLMSYALCRKLEYYDQPVVEQITRKMQESDGTYRKLIHEIVHSISFRETIVAGEPQ